MKPALTFLQVPTPPRVFLFSSAFFPFFFLTGKSFFALFWARGEAVPEALARNPQCKDIQQFAVISSSHPVFSSFRLVSPLGELPSLLAFRVAVAPIFLVF